jgi:hypothetical protein
MISFQSVIIVTYFLLGLISYPYLKNSYFPQFPTKLERFIMVLLALCWLISVPVTFVMRQYDSSENVNFETSYDGFLGREA